MKKIIRRAAVALGTAAYCLLFYLFYLQAMLPDTLSTPPGQSVTLAQGSVEVREVMRSTTAEKNAAVGEARLLGLFRIKSMVLRDARRPSLVPGGVPFGIKMLTQGAMVVGLGTVQEQVGTAAPAKSAGLCPGDVILACDDQPVDSAQTLNRMVEQSSGQPLKLRVRREGREFSVAVTPACGSDGRFQLGLWVRDSSAGIGTVTWYDPETGTFGGLGHGVCDVDTGELMPFQSGEVVEVLVTGAQKGEKGRPGELFGEFHTSVELGVLTDNTGSGVCGRLYQSPSDAQPLPIAFRQEVRPGPAEILTTLDGVTPQRFAVELQQVDLRSHTQGRDLLLRITDPELISRTGGIVQGMSGSPIIQDGKLVGAVTHVLVNDPTRGYGIFIENMLDTAG